MPVGYQKGRGVLVQLRKNQHLAYVGVQRTIGEALPTQLSMYVGRLKQSFSGPSPAALSCLKHKETERNDLPVLIGRRGAVEQNVKRRGLRVVAATPGFLASFMRFFL